MVTAMAVNFAEVIMTNFEEKLLESFKSQHGHKRELWLRFIGSGTQKSLLKFVQFCDSSAQANNF